MKMATKFQRGVSLSGLMYLGIVFAAVALLLMRVAPSAIEYYKLKKDTKATVVNLQPGATVSDVRKAFAKYAEVDHLDFKPEELDISKENDLVVISFAYDKKIPLFANVSLLISYSASTAGDSKE